MDQANKLIARLNKAESDIHELRLNFSTKLSGIISSKKIILLKISEEDFKRKMIHELKGRKKK